MAWISKYNIYCHYLGVLGCAYLLLCNVNYLSTLEGCETCGKFSHEEIAELDSITIDPETLGEFSAMFIEFQKAVENPDLSKRELFVWKWCKKVKKWFVKRMYYLFKEVLGIRLHKGNKSKDYCAYIVAKFQRDVDKYHNTGPIKNTIQRIRKEYEDDERANVTLHPFFRRIKHYAKNKHDRAKHPDHGRYDYMRRGSRYENENLLEGVPIKCAFGGVEFACGALVFALPFPGCKPLGGAMMYAGGQMIYEGLLGLDDKPKPKKIIDLTGHTVDTCAH